MLTYEGPDEADHVLREVEEREVVEPPPLRPESLRRSKRREPSELSHVSLCREPTPLGMGGERGCLQRLLEDPLGDVGRPDPADAEGEHGHARSQAAAAAVDAGPASHPASAALALPRGHHGAFVCVVLFAGEGDRSQAPRGSEEASVIAVGRNRGERASEE